MSRFFLLAVFLSLLSLTSGQSLCVKYTTALFTVDNSTNEYALVSAVVARAVLGGNFSNPTAPTTNYTIDGIAQNPTTSGNTNPIIGYFNGQIVFRTNPTNPDYTRSGFNNTDFATLAAHLFSYFGALLGCNFVGTAPYPAIGTSDMYGVHKNMNLSQTQMTYFDNAVAYSLLSFGVSMTDATAAGNALGYFNRCGGYITGNAFISATALNQICDAGMTACPTAATNANCSAYAAMITSSSTGSGPIVLSSSTGSSGAVNAASVSVALMLTTVVAAVSMML